MANVVAVPANPALVNAVEEFINAVKHDRHCYADHVSPH